ncbi:MAG: ABC transporter substrate-binding protein [Rhodospirillales bacterium]|nr:ABC transporter substrate-binding protein [Rhodospirillales bacterium]
MATRNPRRFDSFAVSRRQTLAGSAALLAASAWPSRAQAPRRGGRFVVAADSEPRNLNPAIVASNGVFHVASKIVEPLAEAAYGTKDGLAPRLATSWEGAADGLSATFRLRAGVTWHDGKPFSSADVAFSALEVWRKLQNFGRVVFKDLSAVDTPDSATAVFRFAKPTPFQLIRNALPSLTAVVPRHLYEGTDIGANPYNAKPVGTGPFAFAEARPGEYTRLVRNRTYRDAGQPFVDEIIYRVLPDRAAATGALEAGEVHLAAFSQVPLDDLARVGKVPGLQVVTKGYEALTYQLVVEINHRRKELADLRVRRAIAHAIDRDFVVRTVFLGYAQVSDGPVPKNDPQFHAAGLAMPGFDPARANALLDEAGYRRDGRGVRMRLRLLPAPFFGETKAFGAYLRQALGAVGIEAEIVGNDTPGHIKAVYSDHAFDLAVGPPVYRGDPAISTTVLAQGGLPAGVPFTNQGGYRDEAMDALIARAASTLDEATRTELYREFQRKVVADLPFINVAEWGFTSVASRKAHNLDTNPRWPVSNWADVWLEA